MSVLTIHCSECNVGDAGVGTRCRLNRQSCLPILKCLITPLQLALDGKKHTDVHSMM